MKTKTKISKAKLVMSITIGIACFALMLVMFMQFKVVKQTDITSIETMRESDLRTELSDWKAKYTELTELYDDVTSRIAEYQSESETDEETAQLLQSELAELNEAIGLTDVEGEGITITIQDNGGQELPDDMGYVSNISETDLLVIINELFDAGAEAISINDNRIVAMSDIFRIGGAYLQVNSEPIRSPYVIKAIGDPTYLESAAYNKDGRLTALQEAGHSIQIESSKNRKIQIQKYNGTISTKYMN